MATCNPLLLKFVSYLIKTYTMKILITIVISASFIACKKQSNSLLFTPSCILNKIEDLKNKPKQNPPAEVYEYNYLNKKVYYFTSDCCDQYNYLYDNNCNIICAPDGGITGGGDGRCGNFNEAKEKGKLIWKDER
jgi:hypothetical protein